jgi:N-acetylglutamate synthase-like GNAT family acetyltransferase
MAGYFRDPELTGEVIKDGWFHSGDLGYLDGDGHLFVTGRAKEMIVTHGGKKLFPEDLERPYAGIAGVKEMCVVGQVRPDGKGEEPVAVLVCDPQAASGGDTEALRQSIRQAFRDRSKGLPALRIVRHLLFWDQPLPKTSTMKVKRLSVQRIINAGALQPAWTGTERRSRQRRDFTVTQAREIDVQALLGLFAQTDWALGRSADHVRKLLESATMVWSVWRQGDLLGFVRVLSDHADVAVVQDLIVREDWRGREIGSILMRRVLGDPRLTDVKRFFFWPAGDRRFLERFGLTVIADGVAVRLEAAAAAAQA